MTSLLALLACTEGPSPTTAVLAIATVEITPDQGELSAVGETIAFSARALDRSGEPIPGLTFSWSSSDARVATVDPDGKATAMGQGSTTIQATVPGATGVATLDVMAAQ